MQVKSSILSKSEKSREVLKDHYIGVFLYSGERPQGVHRNIEDNILPLPSIKQNYTPIPLFSSPMYEDNTPVPLYGIVNVTNVYNNVSYAGRLVYIYDTITYRVLLPEGEKIIIRRDSSNKFMFTKTKNSEKSNIAKPIELVEKPTGNLFPKQGQILHIIPYSLTFLNSEFNNITLDENQFENVEFVDFTMSKSGHYNSTFVYRVKEIKNGEEKIKIFNSGEFLFKKIR